MYIYMYVCMHTVFLTDINSDMDIAIDKYNQLNTDMYINGTTSCAGTTLGIHAGRMAIFRDSWSATRRGGRG